MFRDRLDPHPAYIEWWYLSGHLQDTLGVQYSFLHCIFKANPRLSNLPIYQSIPLQNYYFVHRFVRADDNSLRQQALDYFVTLDDHSLLLTEPWQMHYRTLAGRHQGKLALLDDTTISLAAPLLNLTMHSQKPPLDLSQRTDELSKWSFSRLSVEGTVITTPEPFQVTGQAWLDHHWSLQHLEEIGWHWFALQLDDQSELMIAQYNGTAVAVLCYADGSQAETTDLTLQPLTQPWWSPHTGMSYQLGWQLTIPQWQIVYAISPIHQDQELCFNKIRYWEGPIHITGQRAGQLISGRGFLEITNPTSMRFSFLSSDEKY